jgi:histidinol-phosphate aminotransferase
VLARESHRAIAACRPLLALAQAMRGRAVLVVDRSLRGVLARAGRIALLGAIPGAGGAAHAVEGARARRRARRRAARGSAARAAAAQAVGAVSDRRSSAALALRALSPGRCGARSGASRDRAGARRLAQKLAGMACVRRVYPSDANFLLVRFLEAATAQAQLLGAGIVVRAMSAMPGLEDALRITVGTRRECEAVLAALEPQA